MLSKLRLKFAIAIYSKSIISFPNALIFVQRVAISQQRNAPTTGHEYISYSPFERVVITGVGAVTSLGPSLCETWDNIIDGYSGIQKQEYLTHPNVPCKVASKIARTDNEVDKDSVNNNNPPSLTLFDSKAILTKSESYYKSHQIQYALAAADEAMNDAKLIECIGDDATINKYRVGVIFGTAAMDVGLITQIKDYNNMKTISPYLLPNVLTNSCSAAVSLRYGFCGPTLSPSTACAASAHAIQEGYLLIATGICDIVLAGGSEALISPESLAAFSRINALSSKYNDEPHKASRPWDKNRDGFVMSEGGGCLILESESVAKQRNATNIYGEIIGIGATSDAYHVTNMEPSGKMIQHCMQLAIERGKGITNDPHLVERLGYINAHAPSTQAGDRVELKAILDLLHQQYNGDDAKIRQKIQENMRISSTKSSLGHLVGAAGVVEAILCLQAMKTGIAPPTLNMDEPDDIVPNYINLVPHYPQTLAYDTEYALSNSFGFGGTNASILFKKRNSFSAL